MARTEDTQIIERALLEARRQSGPTWLNELLSDAIAALSRIQAAPRQPQEPPAPCGHTWDRSLHRGCPRCAIERVEKIHGQACELLKAADKAETATLGSAGSIAFALDRMRYTVRKAIEILASSEGPSPSLQAVNPPQGPAGPPDGGAASERGSDGSL